MAPSQDNVIFRPGNPPENAGWPGGDPSDETSGDLRIRRNVRVPMRDGLHLMVDLYQPADPGGPTPVLIAWAPYGKHGALDWRAWPGHEVDLDSLSPYTAFETPDPAYWTGQGYTVILADARGTWGSEGDVTMLSPDEAAACYDLVEWAGTQDWSNGRVGMAGVSYYAAIQWAVAALRPPHLAAINPWEGFSHLYYEVGTHGGIPETQFVPLLAPLIANSHGQVEDLVANAMNHPYLDEYWQSKAADLTAIEVPAYVVASWTDHGLHTRGTLEGYKKVSSQHKWLEVHGRKKWAYYYQPSSVAKQTAFFDRFLKDQPNDVDQWPPVLLEVRDRSNIGDFRAEQEWPPARTRYVPLYLDPATSTLTDAPPADAGSVAYDATSGSVTFRRTFDTDTELTGHMKLRLWVEADGADNLDLFVGVQKLDATGERVPFPFFATLDDGDVALGWLRASRRELDKDASTDHQPVYLHQRDLPLSPGEIVPVDIEIWPSGTVFRSGESLQLVVQGHDLHVYPPQVFAQAHQYTINAGQHVVHAGGAYDSHLLIPVIDV